MYLESKIGTFRKMSQPSFVSDYSGFSRLLRELQCIKQSCTYMSIHMLCYVMSSYLLCCIIIVDLDLIQIWRRNPHTHTRGVTLILTGVNYYDDLTVGIH